MKNLFKQEKAITLIALVITIVVLLIISAVIIATLTGDNGLITKAFSANRASREVEIKEKIQLAASAAEIINYGELRKNEFDIELEKEFGKDNYELLTIGKEFLIIIENIEHRIDINGNISSTSNIESVDISNAGDLSKGGQYDGLTEETAYRITCIEDLLEWSNNANNYKNKNIKLENTIDFNSTGSYKDYKSKLTDINGNGEVEELITELTTGTGFKPIAKFEGIFNGQDNYIRNLYENYNTNNIGLISDGNRKGTIKNLNITGNINGNENVGAIVGKQAKELYNCNNYANIFGDTNIGGLEGYGVGSSILNCNNYGEIFGTYTAGGISGLARSNK